MVVFRGYMSTFSFLFFSLFFFFAFSFISKIVYDAIQCVYNNINIFSRRGFTSSLYRGSVKIVVIKYLLLYSQKHNHEASTPHTSCLKMLLSNIFINLIEIDRAL